MVLNKELRDKILSFVIKQPRSIQEVAFFIEKNWRTANSYIEKIRDEYGFLQTKVFREGSRGALKIVYYQTVESSSKDGIREKLFQKILSSRNKEDFLPFDIYQYVDENKRSAFMEAQSEYTITKKQDIIKELRKTKKQLLIFSGNLSWAHSKQDGIRLLSVFEELISRGIKIKILVDVNFSSIVNIKKVLSLNNKLKLDLIEIRHSVQPFRAFIVDDVLVRFKEEERLSEDLISKRKKRFLFYDIFDEEWILWIQQIFWNYFNNSIGANERIKDLESVKMISLKK